jgi:hypothetical protein
VISGHALLAVAGVPIWLVYLVTDERRLAWVAASIVVGVALLGLIMFVRWSVSTAPPGQLRRQSP